MSWLFSQALVEASLVDTSLVGEQFVQLNGNNTQQAYCAPDKMTDFSRLSRFGMMYKPLTENLGEKLLMLYLEDFLVPTFQPQEKAQELMEKHQECGEKWRGSFTKYDLNLSLWRTHQCSLLGDLEEFLETWPQWGLMRDGECWEQQMLAQTIKETEFGLWPTPTVCGNYNRKGASKTSGDGLATAVAQWPTPTMRDYKGANSLATTNKKIEEGLRAHMGQLPNAVQHTEQKPIGGTLNPMWVEWLMGWPLEWTDLKPLEMDKSLSVQQQPGES